MNVKRVLVCVTAASLSAAVLAGPAAAAGPPQMVKNINASGSSDPQELTAMGGKLYFSARGGGKGRELWASDGTGQGTQRVKDLRPGPMGSDPIELVAIGSLLYFTADDGVNGREVWKTDGTEAGTQMLTEHDTPPDGHGSPHWLTAVSGLLYYFADNVDDRLELWKTNGTTAGTSRVKILPPRAFVFEPPAAHDGRLFFGLYQSHLHDGGQSGIGLWVSNGTAQGTKHFFSVVVDESYPAWITSAGGKLYWNDDLHGMYRSNGTAAKTKSMGGVLSLVWLVEFNGSLYFNGSDDGFPSHGDLWKSNGTPAGTTLVKDVSNGARELTPVGDLLFFSTLADNDDLELWVSDGSTAGTEHLASFFSFQPLDNFVDLDGTLYFNAMNSLWKSDGSVSGTVEVHGGIGHADQFTNVGGTLFYTSEGPTGDLGVELWKYVP